MFLMMAFPSNNWTALSDAAILLQIGQFIKSTRLKQDKTQEALAQEAGINRWTIGQLERGEAVALTTLIQVLRALDSLYILEQFQVVDEISPIEYAKLKRQERQRASRTIHSQQEDD